MTRFRLSMIALVAICLLGAPAWAADDDASKAETAERVVVRGAEELGGPIVPHRFFGDLRDLPRLPMWEPGDSYLVNPRRSLDEIDTFFTPAKLDPLLARQQEVGTRGAAASSQLLSFEGVDTGASPPDPSGDIGKNYYIHAVNASSFAIFDKTDGSLVAGPTAMDSLSSGQCAAGAGDPIIVYDDLAERWLMTEFTNIGNNDLCLYVSMTDDPVTGGWCAYEFQDSSFPDYPKWGIWPNVYMATSQQGNSPPVYAFDRENMLNCDAARPTQKLTGPGLPGLGFEIFTPANVDGAAPPNGSPAFLMRHRDTELGNQGPPGMPDEDILEIWQFEVDWDTPANTALTQLPDIMVSEFDSNLCPPINQFSCVPQPNNGPRLDPLLEVIMNQLVYRNFGTHETLVGVLQTDIGDFEDHSGERWFELRKTGQGDWQLHQEGTWSPDAEHRFMGTIGMDRAGNILLGYALSSTTTSPSVRYTGRLASDPLGVMTEPEQELVAGTGRSFSSRFGDYSHMGVDPVDDCTFWFTVEYTEGVGNTANQIGKVVFPSCLEAGGIFDDDFETGDTGEWDAGAP
ncbi:MAG: hypothetical protein AAGN46_15965 [Acidobacteriota bacterium]